MSNTTSTESVLNRQWTPNDQVEGRRLDDQHTFIVNSIYPGRYIYDTSINLQPGSRILDAGAGTGAWSLDLSKELPNTIFFDCVDIMTEAYPTKYPSNITFSEGSVTALPHEWKDTFDLIHQRLLIGRLQAPEWPNAISEFYRVLKPNGTAQFFEYDFPGWNQSPNEKRLVEILGKLYEKRGLVLDCGLRLARTLQQVGFVDIHLEIQHARVGNQAGEYGIIGKRVLINGLGKMSKYLEELGVIPVEEHRELLKAVGDEWDNVEGGKKLSMVVAYAKKPSVV